MICYRKLYETLDKRRIVIEDLERIPGIPKGTISKIRNENYISLNAVDSICCYLGVQPGEILEYVENPRLRSGSYIGHYLTNYPGLPIVISKKMAEIEFSTIRRLPPGTVIMEIDYDISTFSEYIQSGIYPFFNMGFKVVDFHCYKCDCYDDIPYIYFRANASVDEFYANVNIKQILSDLSEYERNVVLC